MRSAILFNVFIRTKVIYSLSATTYDNERMAGPLIRVSRSNGRIARPDTADRIVLAHSKRPFLDLWGRVEQKAVRTVAVILPWALRD